MRIRLIAAGSRMPAWVEEGFREYAKRLPRELELELSEIRLGHRGKSADRVRARADESARMLADAGTARIVALDVGGVLLDTARLAVELDRWRNGGRDVALLIGGPDGLAPECLDRAGLRWSLSPLTLPHGLVRIVVAEQLYRASSILQGHPYHRA
ncbi:MAG: 23S rRNA (pseudouridine(1915)-N(3))-methyltransferase RlmH [Gammaproteobacteria bacterium]|nr:23S rRNA (pseudouridine(1915)-N(3))-methyltransferase RlmH [Gammaproteobacteria bacterium]